MHGGRFEANIEEIETSNTIIQTVTNPHLFHASIPVKTLKLLAVVATVQRFIIKPPTAFLHAMHSDSGCGRSTLFEVRRLMVGECIISHAYREERY